MSASCQPASPSSSFFQFGQVAALKTEKWQGIRNGRLLLRAPFILRTRTFVGYCMMRLIADLARARASDELAEPSVSNRKRQERAFATPLIARIVNSSSIIDPGEVTAD